MEFIDLIRTKSATYIDVREPYEFNSGHIAGAVNIPLGEIHFRVEEIKNLNRPIILYCVTGNRSGQALRILVEDGFKEVYNGGSYSEIKLLLMEPKLLSN